MKYYVYQLIDPRTNQPFYVGKGYNLRMYTHEGEAKSGRWNNREKCKRIQEIWNAGLSVEYIQEWCESDEQSRAREKELILILGRMCNGSGILTNVHVGGNGGGRVGKAVCQYSQSGVFVNEYASASEAERHTGVRLSKITAVCRGDWKCAGGYQWKWKGNQPIENYVRHNTHNRNTVYQYTAEGVFVAEFETLSNAANHLGIKAEQASKISSCCNGKLPSYGGYQWKHTKHDKIDSIVLQRKRVAQYTMDNQLIRTFESISEAGKHTGVSNIGKCCNGQYKQVGGYIWKFVSS